MKTLLTAILIALSVQVWAEKPVAITKDNIDTVKHGIIKIKPYAQISINDGLVTFIGFCYFNHDLYYHLRSMYDSEKERVKRIYELSQTGLTVEVEVQYAYKNKHDNYWIYTYYPVKIIRSYLD